VSLSSILEIALRKSQFTSTSPAHARRRRTFATFARVVSTAASAHQRRGVTPRRTDAQGLPKRGPTRRSSRAGTRFNLAAPCKLPHPTLTYIRQPTLSVAQNAAMTAPLVAATAPLVAAIAPLVAATAPPLKRQLGGTERAQ